MLQTLSRHPKRIAAFFAITLYFELILVPAASNANTGVYRPSIGRNLANRHLGDSNFAKDFFASGPLAENKGASPFSTIATSSPLNVKKAFTTGPTQPETQSYQSVNANNMVDLFTGDFSYNIPLLDVGGYPVNLHYQSGITMDQEASWVGLGWNINPGSVSRNMRGLPDDFSGEDEITKTIGMKPNRTIGITGGFNMELIGVTKKLENPYVPKDSVKGRATTMGISLGVFHNTYRGYGTEIGLNAGINSGGTAKGPLSGGLSLTNNSQDGFQVSPSLTYQLAKNELFSQGALSLGTSYNARSGIHSLQLTGEFKRNRNFHNHLRYTYGIGVGPALTFARPSYTPTISIPMRSTNISFTAKVGSEAWALHPNFYLRGYGSRQIVDEPQMKLPAYGYLYYEKAKDNQNVLLDFNREKDVSFHHSSPHIAVPFYTYDTYSITGEGTGGLFRPYRAEIGYVFDHVMNTKNDDDKLSLDVGFGGVVHAGVDYSKVYAVTKNNPWMSNNLIKDVIGFKEQDTTFENVYFKNPGEKTSVNRDFLNTIGNDKLVRVDLEPSMEGNTPNTYASRNLSTFKNSRFNGRITLPTNPVRQTRDKRTQQISYLTAVEAAAAGLDKNIKTYNLNSFPATSCNTNYQTVLRCDDSIHRKHHISEITVLNPDGRRYVYGTPVYNINQVDVTMSTLTGDINSGLVSYTPGNENSISNNRGKEGYYSKEEIPSYAHSFLLSGILSADYADVTGDGITEDDQGDAVKFNYTRIYGPQEPFTWRAPYSQNKAFYSEGLKTDSRDERGSYSYGKKEVWYLNSIESKTMIATFVLETDSVRKDGFGVVNENGGQNAVKKLYRLKEINLYTKADYLKNGVASAKPIKSVHFEYSYELCRKNPGSVTDSGKLTLKKVWFTYNKNNKGERNPYIFSYQNGNPDFNSKSMDRWGNYKDPSKNPGGPGSQMSNADYPYSLQPEINDWNSANADSAAAVWTLSEVRLPSGGKIKVKYESDDYAFVQNKRAMQFFSIVGFGDSLTATPVDSLYRTSSVGHDYNYAFIQVTDPVSDKADIRRKYLEGVNKLFLKVFVKMPDDPAGWGKGHEMIPVYADIEDFGVKSGSGGQIIWIKMGSITEKESATATTAIQFLRLNLPSKAYPYSEPGDNFNLRAVLGMLGTLMDNINTTLTGFPAHARNKNWCNVVDTAKSFVRLNNPVYRKFGGGLRVKRVEVYDNWSTMTGGQQQESNYGQEYDYTTIADINGVPTRISSGVATYEPAIGNDENPFRVPHKVYPVKIAALAPTDYMYTEEPFAETLFPSPMIGYCRVRVQTIHKDKKSANGFQETEFYTAKDFPVIVEFTPLDSASKKSYSPPIANVLRFDAKNYVTLSQGFKIELNDMHGKLKSQASYSQNDSTTPISYTYNYFRLQNDFAGQPRLSNTVAVVDSANGNIDTTGEIGKEVELMVDIREQTSTTISGSVEVNVDVVHPAPPISLGSSIPLPSKETNRYRAIAVLKVVNRYGILDSVIHVEKGSRVSTRNVLYDGETGEVLLSRTNNEFDDPIFNFSYPAHWAYTGMGPAYKNQGAIFKNILFKQGIMYYRNGTDTIPVSRFFESGDELLVNSYETRIPFSNDSCSSMFYSFLPFRPVYNKIWAIQAERGQEGHKGMIFIDKTGNPYSALAGTVKIIRSGHRNMSSVPTGEITSIRSPLKIVEGKLRLHFDSTSGVIAANAARFKDFWRVDSTLNKKDTVMILPVLAQLDSVTLDVDDVYKLEFVGRPNRKRFVDSTAPRVLEASSWDLGTGNNTESETKTWFRFNFNHPAMHPGMIVHDASLTLLGHMYRPQLNERYSGSFPAASNQSYIQRTTRQWIRDGLRTSGGVFDILTARLEYFTETRRGETEISTRVSVPETARFIDTVASRVVSVGPMVQNMIDDYWASNRNYSPAMMMRLVNNGGETGNILWSRMSFGSSFDVHGNIDDCAPVGEGCTAPKLKIRYYKACANGSSPAYAETPTPGYYCYSEPKDTFICRPNIDTIFNPYRWGVLGNWRVDRAYTYYAQRAQSDPSVATNIRVDGQIKSFEPYWAFSNNYLSESTDSSRWVWNSEVALFNSKGFEIENHDPLDRRNSGHYGYKRSLPVAVGQNTQNRNMLFDGFEDYDYSTDTCSRCPSPRFIDLRNNGTLVDSVSHSGFFSIRIPGNTIGSTQVPVIPFERDTIQSKISIKIDSTAIVHTEVTGQGQGLKIEYRYFPWITTSCSGIGSNEWHTLPNPGTVNFDENLPPPICAQVRYEMRWTGKIQPRFSEVYRFYVECDDNVRLFVNDRRISQGTLMEVNHNWDDRISSDTITLQAGHLYDIRIEYTQRFGDAKAKLFWESASEGLDLVPVTNLYLPTMIAADSAGSFISDTTWCVKPKGPRPTRVMHDRFSPLQGTKIVMGAWVKEDAACVGGTYSGNRIELEFNSGGTIQLIPKGPVIEGWQRIEDTVTIPAAATTMNIRLRSLSSTAVFFDDIRIHPFNANMKSFVYNPVNIRLMAELDENNYATFFEYDDDGSLIRIKKETERGIKTIRENRSALFKKQ